MFTTFTPGSRDLSHERQRHDADAAQCSERAKADGERFVGRALVDLTRQVARGNRQARENIVRERTLEDRALEAERDRSDRGLDAERKLSDAALTCETQARVNAEDTLERRGADDAHRSEELREVLKLVVSQLRSAGDLAGASELRSANARARHLLEDALDPTDSRGRYHDEGGSG